MNEIKTWKSGINFGGREVLGDRSGQEDYSLFRILKGGTELLVVLADGMGGHTSGEVASKNAVTVFDSTFNSYPSDSVPTKLGAALQQANNNLARLILENQALEGMGCTLIGVHISMDGLRWISVGDSLLYLYRNGQLMQLNADHSMSPVIEELRISGKISREEAANHPNKNALRSAVMGSDIPMIDSPNLSMPIFHGDILIAASDGLLTLEAEQISSILSKHKNQTADEISSALVNGVLAKKKPRQDNTTVQVVLIPDTYPRKNKTLKGYLILLILSLVISAFAVVAYFFNASTLVTRLLSSESEVKVLPQPTPVPVALPETQPTQQLPNSEAPGDVKKSSKDSKKPSSKPDEGKSKPQKSPSDSALKNGQSPILKPIPDQSTAPASAGVEGILSGEDKGTVKPKSDPKTSPPTKGASDTQSDT
jgi:serine/threonine protein phosphatase PrpC